MASPQITLTDPGQWLQQQAAPARPAMGPPEANAAPKLTDPGQWLQQNATDHAVRDTLKNQGFLDSLWGSIKGLPAMAHDLISGDMNREYAADHQRYLQLDASGTPEQKREFAKEYLLKSIPGLSTLYKVGQGNLAGAAGDVLGLAITGKAIEAVPEIASGVRTTTDVITNPKVARAALGVVPKGAAFGKFIDAVQEARGAIKPRVNDYAPSFTETPIQAAGIIGERTAPPMPESFTQAPIQASEIIGERTAPAAAAPVVETPGMALARASGEDWAKLSAADRGMLEAVARAKANVAAQPAARPPMGPPQAAPREPVITPPPDIPPESGPPAPAPEPAPPSPPAAPAAQTLEYEAAGTRPAAVGRMAPAEAQADFEQRRATLTQDQPPAGPTPGQQFAESQGYDWAKLSIEDRQALEQVAQARANMAAQNLEVPQQQPRAAAAPQTLADLMQGEPATALEQQLADSIRNAQAGKPAAAAPAEPAAPAPAPKPENVFAKNARLAKAVRVADAAQEAKLTSGEIYRMMPADFAKLVGEKSISADTMAMVVDKLRRLEAEAERAKR